MGPLSGVRVVELGTYVAVPKAARMMADWGAEVIKVEAPRGEDWRYLTSGYELPVDEDNNPGFQVENANKKAIAINLKDPQGKEVLFRILENADVFLTNTRDKGLEKLGLSYDAIKDRFPSLIYAHLSGLGTTGPDKDRPGFDLTAFWARSGILTFWAQKGTPPAYPGPGVGDTATGQAMLAGILAALYQRERTGRGENIEVSLLNTALWCNSMGVIMGQPQYHISYPKGVEDMPEPSCVVMKSSDDRWFILALKAWDSDYVTLLRALELDEYVDDEKLKPENIAANVVYAHELLVAGFARFTGEELARAFTQHDISYEMLATIYETSQDRQAWANGYLRNITLADGSSLTVPQTPVQFGSLGAEMPYELAPLLGEHSLAVLKAAGYSDEEAAALCGSGVVVQHQ